MSRPPPTRRHRRHRTAAVALVVFVLGTVPAHAQTPMTEPARPESTGEWAWPLDAPRRVTTPFVAPPHRYGAGHRGIDLAAVDPGAEVTVRSPAPGTVAFAGRVVDRSVVTIEHDAGLVSTFEPIQPAVAAGTRVDTGDVLGTIALGGHATPGTVHFGVRLDGEYINPLRLLGEVPRAVLLPCC